MKKSTRYSLLFCGVIYVCFVVASIFLAYQTYKYPPIRENNILAFIGKIFWDSPLFLLNMLLFLGSTAKSAAHLFGKAKLPWAFLWAFMLYGLIGLWAVIPIGCYAYLCYFRRA